MTDFGVPRDAYGEILSELGETRKDIVVLDADLSLQQKHLHLERSSLTDSLMLA